jgi:D-alanine--poly(phosphoribitol) ligase subunit 2
MNMENLLEILRELHPDVDFETCDTLIDSNILDSFDIITLIAEISSEFDVNIPAEEIVPENFNSAKALYALIRRLSDEE